MFLTELAYEQSGYTCLSISLWIPQTVLHSANTVVESENSPIFGAILSGTMCEVFVCGIQNSKEDQRKVVAESATNLILDCCDFRLKRTECTFWPRKLMSRVHFLSGYFPSHSSLKY